MKYKRCHVLPLLAWLLAACGTTPAKTETDAAKADAAQGADAATDAAAEDAAADVTADSAAAANEYDLAFVSLLSGKFAVVDTAGMTKLTEIGNGHVLVHGMGVMPGQKTVYVPNGDDNTYERMVRGSDGAQWLPQGKFAAGVQLGQVRMSVNGAFLVATAGHMPLSGPPMPGTMDEHLSIFRTSDNSVTATVKLPSPNALAISADGAKVYVGNAMHGTVSVVSTAAGKEIAVLPLPLDAAGKPFIGPASLALSPDDRWLLTADLMGRKFTLLDLDESTPAATFPVTDFAHWVSFSGDGKRFFAMTFEQLAKSDDELGATKIPTHLLVFDTATRKQVGDVQWTASIWHVTAHGGSRDVFVSASFGTLLRYDDQLQLTGAAVLTVGQPMPAMVVAF